MPPVRPTRRPSPFATLEGLFEGHQYRRHYTDPVLELSREPDPNICIPDDPRPPPLRLRNLECIKTLGSGQDGQVLLIRTTRNMHPLDLPGSLFALKVFKRKIIRALDKRKPEKKNVERSLLAELPWNSFVTGAVQVFHDRRNLYLMLEFIPCGNLRSLIQKHAPFNPMMSAFYFANIVTALNFLQKFDIVHRDIKPENILLGADGYLSLADFGTAAKDDQPDGWLMVGTPTYMAPELYSPQGSSYVAVDWWSAGCVLFEMVTRKMPFYGHSQASIFKKALSGEPEWPPAIRVGRNLRSIISGLLTVDASERIGQGGAFDAMQHPWLASIDWDQIRDRKYLAPYIPNETDPVDRWHDQALPGSSKLPGVKVALTPFHLAYDNRFPEKALV